MRRLSQLVSVIAACASIHCGRIGFETFGPSSDTGPNDPSGGSGGSAATGGASAGGTSGVSADGGVVVPVGGTGGGSVGGGAGTGGSGGSAGSSGGGMAGGGGSGGTLSGGGTSSSGGMASGGADAGGVAVPVPDIVVTTTIDESDLNASPAAPGNDGLSLREAFAYASGLGGSNVVGFDPLLAGPVIVDNEIVVSDTDGVLVWGDGQVIDCAGLPANVSCFDVVGGSVTFQGVEIQNAPTYPISVNNVDSFELIDSDIHDSQQILISRDALAARLVGNRIHDISTACILAQTTVEILDNELWNCSTICIQVNTTGSAQNSVVRGNLCHTTTTGMLFGSNSANSIADHNTFANVSSTGIQLGAQATGIYLRNNAIVDAPVGLNGGDSQIAQKGGNLYWNNATAPVIGATPDATSMVADPLFVSPGTGNYAPGTGSPLIDGGIIINVDRNGSVPGDFNGTAPDIGYLEP